MNTDSGLRDETLELFLEEAPNMGKIALEHFGNLSDSDVDYKKGHLNDPVTIADREISDYIIALISQTFGEQRIILTEESVGSFGYSQKEILQMGKPMLIIDELDGTRNFTQGKEHFSVLLGLAEIIDGNYNVTVGVVYKPLTGESYFATVDNGSKIRDKDGIERDLSVSKRKSLSDCQVNVAIGRETFPLDYGSDSLEVAKFFENIKERYKTQVDKHSKFSCGLEVMDLAKGDVDVYMCAKAANWDYAAASLILRQAGGQAYIAKSQDMLSSFQPWKLQLDDPSKYYPAFFTNRAIDDDLIKHLKSYYQ